MRKQRTLLTMPEPSLHLARRIEAADVRVGRALVRAFEALYPREEACFVELGGAAWYAVGSSKVAAQVVGLGFDGPVDDSDLDRLMELFEARGFSAEVQLASLAEPTLLPRLLSRGFTPVKSEIILAREIVSADRQWTPPIEYSIQGLHPARNAQWVRTVALGFVKESELSDSIEHQLHAAVAAEGFIGFLVLLGMEIVAAGGIQCAGDVACLFGHATNERFRRRGLQRALIHHSLAVCAERGLTLAKLSALPDTTSLRNAERAGFAPVYTRTTLTRSPR
jgi:ribosomal protein S18 acetylase RimI-like enzyme